MLSILSLGKMVIGSFYGRMIGVAFLALGALAANNAYQRHVGGNAREAKIVEKTNEKAKERNAKARKIRSGNSVSGAAKRLCREYGPGSC